MASQATPPPYSRRVALGLGGGAMLMALASNGHPAVAANEITTLAANKALARRVFDEAVNRRSSAALTEVLALDYVDSGSPGRRMPGPAGMPLTLGEFQDLAPNIYATIDDTIAEGDLVALRVTWRGEHPPAGTHVVGRTMHLFRIEQGLLAAGWSVGWEWLERLSAGPRRRPGNPLID